jgi:conjugal transfer pilus assembly protein TraK
MLAAIGSSAHAQTVNPFVNAAQAPSTLAIPAPPTPPNAQTGKAGNPKGEPKPNQLSLPTTSSIRPGASATPEQTATMVFGNLHPPVAPKPVQHEPTATSNLSKAKPGQTLTAPPLPNMPPVPMPQVPVANIGPQPYFGGNAPTIDATKLREQTDPVKTLKFVAEVGKTYRVKMSDVTPNLIMSPFEHPKLIMASANAVHFVAHGSSLVVTVAPGAPVGAYLTGEDPNDPLVALVFDPENLPPQNYELQVDGFVVKTRRSEDAKQTQAPEVRGDSTQYTQRVVQVIEQAMTGTIPDGFGPVSRRHWPLARNQGGLIVAPVEVLSSGDEIIDVVSVSNTTKAPVSLEENDFYKRGVEGVAFAHHQPIKPGESVQVGILRRASQSDNSDILMSVSHP